ncbi:MAG: winged helix-turn-helix domain-containing protein [Thermoprotei archaeon]
MSRVEGARSKLKIYMDILRVIEEEGEAIPTHILYKANLSHDRLTAYLGDLEGRGLIAQVVHGENRVYTLTSEGKKFLRELKRAQAFLGGFGISL